VTEPANEAIVREHFRLLDERDPAGAAAVFADRSVNHGRPVSRAQVEAVLRSLCQAAPDTRTEVLEMVSDGEVVACRLTRAGTHLGTPEIPFVDGGVFSAGPPTGGPFQSSQIHWFRIRNGMVVEHWASRDDIGVARQLGLVDGIPSP
jgi:predicted ester cyclase